MADEGQVFVGAVEFDRRYEKNHYAHRFVGPGDSRGTSAHHSSQFIHENASAVGDGDSGKNGGRPGLFPHFQGAVYEFSGIRVEGDYLEQLGQSVVSGLCLHIKTAICRILQ